MLHALNRRFPDYCETDEKSIKNPFVKPDMRTFTSLIFTYMSVRSPDAYERA